MWNSTCHQSKSTRTQSGHDMRFSSLWSLCVLSNPSKGCHKVPQNINEPKICKYWTYLVYKGLKYGKKVKCFVGFSCFFNVFLHVWGVLIIPKWLIKVPGNIPILVEWFLELPTFSPNLASYISFWSPRCFKNYTTNYGIIIKNIFLHISTFRNSKISTPLPDIETVELIFSFLCWNMVGPKQFVFPSVFKEFSCVESRYFWTIIFE